MIASNRQVVACPRLPPACCLNTLACSEHVVCVCSCSDVCVRCLGPVCSGTVSVNTLLFNTFCALISNVFWFSSLVNASVYFQFCSDLCPSGFFPNVLVSYDLALYRMPLYKCPCQSAFLYQCLNACA